jgi:3-oxoacyl-[acyl-carrier-protein] synthase II
LQGYIGKKRRVVITGAGLISPLGIGIEECWNNAAAGLSGIDKITFFDVSDYPSKIAGEVKEFNQDSFIDRRESRKMDRFIQLAVAASSLAVKDAFLEMKSLNPERVGVIIGSGIGGLRTMETQHSALLNGGVRKVSPYLVPMMITNLAAGQVSIFLGAKGLSYCTVSACASSAHAIGESYRAITRGDIDVAVSGGSEAPLTPLGVAGFCAIRALSTRNDEPQKASRPFDIDRDGFVIAEGSGVVIMEEAEAAEKRGAKILCEIVGYGSSSDAYHIVQPDPDGEGAARAIRLAINDAGVEPDEVDYINAHGTSTKYNDELETTAIKKVFGDHSYELAVSSTKSMTGHLLGAAGGLEAIFAAKSISEGIALPTINLENPDPKCDLDYVPNQARSRDINIALSNSFGFGGQNVCLAFQKWQK